MSLQPPATCPPVCCKWVLAAWEGVGGKTPSHDAMRGLEDSEHEVGQLVLVHVLPAEVALEDPTTPLVGPLASTALRLLRSTRLTASRRRRSAS
mmetsp:Transcript_105153/g.267139  ORF Transcript_105153/g.267139 Transcript_105153/m.267139 type:complete len:94 (+) Transcript_105153:350-631(+)